MSVEVPLGKEPKDQRVDVRLWDIMQEVCLQARVLKNTHERAHKTIRRIEKPKDQDERDNNAERDLMLGTGGAPWMDLARDLNRVSAHGVRHVRDGQMSVSSAELIARANVKSSLQVLVNSMFALADKNGLLRTVNIGKRASSQKRYHGKHTRHALAGAFNALTEWDNYMAEQAAGQLLARVSSRDFVPSASSQNGLALPAPSVSSQLSPRKGLD